MVDGQHMSNPSKHVGCVCPCWVSDWDQTPSQHSSQSAMLRGVLSPEDLVDRAVPCPATVASTNISQLGFLWTIVRRSFAGSQCFEGPYFWGGTLCEYFLAGSLSMDSMAATFNITQMFACKVFQGVRSAHSSLSSRWFLRACLCNQFMSIYIYIYFVCTYICLCVYIWFILASLADISPAKVISKDPAALSIATFAFSSLEETSLISVGKTLLAAKLLESIWAVFVDKLSNKLCFE